MCSDLIKGEVVLGVQPALLVAGVQVILGNELAGGSIWADSQTSLVVTYTPSVNKVEDKSHPQVFPACAVTRAQACLKKIHWKRKRRKKFL